MNAIVNKVMCQQSNIDALNRTAKAVTDMPNGTALALEFPATGEAFVATALQTGMVFDIRRKQTLSVGNEELDSWLLEVQTGGWMAISPEVTKVEIGAVYGGSDPRYFTNVANAPFSAVKLEVGDIIEVTEDFFSTAPVAGNNTATLTAGEFVPSTV